MKSIYLSLGSNIGNKIEYLKQATTLIESTKGISLIAISKDYETQPQGFVEQDTFINRALLIESSLEPRSLLSELNRIEQELQRERIIRWGPRTIDIDIIWISTYTSCDPDLTVPHPRTFERAFVIKPLLDLPMVDLDFFKQLKTALPNLGDQGVKEYTHEH